MLNRRHVMGAAAAAAAGVLAGNARAQAFPSRPIRVVVPFPPGGAGDAQVRLLAEPMARSLGQPVVVENRPGGGTIIGSTAVAQAPADGHTLLLMANSFVINAKLHEGTLPYKGIQAFAPVAALTNSPQMVAVNSASPWRSLHDWIEAARARPDTLSFASLGPATTQHIACEMLMRQAGLRMVYVPFNGGAPTVNALLGGHADAILANVSEIQPFVDAGKLRALAVTTAQRLPGMPAMPTVAESGLPGYEVAAWFGLCAPAGTPRDAIARIARAALGAVGDPEVSRKLAVMGLQPYPMDTAQFTAHIGAQYAKYVKVIDEAGIKA